MQNKETITINGGGLVGSLLAVLLAKRKYKIDVFEYRPDPTENPARGGRSINLALSSRGWQALKAAGTADIIAKSAIPMKGRMMHSTDGKTTFQPYGKEGQEIYSVSREGLNQALIAHSKTLGNTTFYFDQKCKEVDLDAQTLVFENRNTGEEVTHHYQYLIGSDGAFSQVRGAMQRKSRFDYAQEYLAHGYKELRIPPTKEGDFALDSNALHIWPRKQFMLIALPNPDKSFTATLFLAYEGETAFEKLATDQAVFDFFDEYFPDTPALIPDLQQQFKVNPTSSLVTIKCGPWNYGNTMLIGDACHAIVPFYGQGMNAGFEDCYLFDQLLQEVNMPLEAIFQQFQANRKKDADAIADLALHNFIEMRDLVADPEFLLRKKIEARLHQLYPDKWLPLYTMVTFSHIPYAVALATGKKQKAIMDQLMQNPEIRAHWEQMDFKGIELLDAYFSS
jgi:kynurenine 3-monooxygenase